MSDELDVWSYQGLNKNGTKRRQSESGVCSQTTDKRFKSNINSIVKEDCRRTFENLNVKPCSSSDTFVTTETPKKQASLLSFISRTVTATANTVDTTSVEVYGEHLLKTSTSKTVINTNSTVTVSGKPRKTCPFYKFAADSPYVVDAFSYGYVDNVQGYFLSHFHADHYGGLTKRFARPIYCSEITGNLVKFVLNVSPQHLHTLPLNSFVSLPDGTRVLLTDANHCPGAVMFLFHLKNGRYILHTGDLRADTDRVISLALWKTVRIDTLYLDTTYCDSRYVFPRQSEIIAKTLELVSEESRRYPNILICVGSYTVGKERLFLAIASLFNCKILVQKRKYDILKCLNDEDLQKRLTLDPSETNLHVIPMDMFSYERLAQYLAKFNGAYKTILAIKPTGWEFNKNVSNESAIHLSRRQGVIIAGVPYSEHSSCEELKNFVQTLRPCKILPTVNNGNAATRKKMQNLFDSWLKKT